MTPLFRRAGLAHLLRKLLPALAAAFLMTAPVAQAAQDASSETAPMADFDGSVMAISNLTPGASVYVVGIGVRGTGYSLEIERGARVVMDDDGDGVVTLHMDAPIPRRSLWLVLDGSGGEYAVVSPYGFLLRPVAFPGNGLSHGLRGALQRVSLERDHLDLFLVRPGVGIWIGNTKDGTTTDADQKKDGRASFDIDQMTPVAPATASAERFKPGDILLVVDRNSFQYFVTRQGL